MKLNLNYYIVGMLLVAVILGVAGWGKGRLVEGMLPFGEYRADTKVHNTKQDEEAKMGVDELNRSMWWNKRDGQNDVKKFSHDMNKSCREAKRLASAQYVYISNFDKHIYLNFDSERGVNGTVYFSSEKPNAPVTSPFEMKSYLSGETIIDCKYQAQKWKVDIVDIGLDNCLVYISTTYAQGDKCKDVPYYLSVGENGKLIGSLYKGSVFQRWLLFPSKKGRGYHLMNAAMFGTIVKGSVYDRDGSFNAVLSKDKALDLSFEPEGTRQFNNLPDKKMPTFVHYKNPYDNPLGKGAGQGAWSSEFSQILNGKYSGKQPITLELSETNNSGAVTVGSESYNVQLLGSNMIVGKNSKGDINLVGEVMNGTGELPRIKWYTIDGNGQYKNISSQNSPYNMNAYSMYISDSKDYLASGGYGPANLKTGLMYSAV